MFRPRTNRAIAPALLILAVIVVAANARFAFQSVSALLESHRWVEHTWEVLNQIDRTLGSVKDAETSSRAYLLTAEQEYFQTYAAAAHRLPVETDRLASLTRDNPTQQRHIANFQAILAQRLSLLDQNMQLRRRSSPDTARALVLSTAAPIQMDHLRQLADAMAAEEHRLLILRTAAAQASRRRARVSVALASLLDLLMILLIFRYLMRESRQRHAAEVASDRLALAYAEVEATSAEVRLLNSSLEERVNQRTLELETTNRELEAFSYSVSHDLRAPLRTIDGFSLALEEDYAGAVDETGRDYIRRVRAGVQRMGQLIDALLQLSRITRAEIVRQDLDLSALATAIAAQLTEENRTQPIEFHIQPDLRAHADPGLLRVALENLMGNAVKFSSKVEQSVVDFGWDPEQDAWFVRDNGAGFDMYYANKLFNAFNRLHGDKDFKGSGIGLATVARVIRRHHGRIWANSVVQHGATFWFTLG